ncbi:glycyl-radical enzyme activating protein [Salidesulfovibrio onnuriiensis]|uniref:glycyl-radical enzyme activating protein n=1 Tax=Salidesulfovibrio onnuriiensis TaxID=2583823 RepID=UPI0011CC1491|nr:glycyl-radical enzyme activating protein [Salidesulfovibrio onnuriiensis]
MSTQGTIFAIKRYAIHDGPNIRTTVFLKGCPLSCAWCHNPEGLSPKIDVVTVADRCVGCGECVRACPQRALTLTEQGISRDRGACDQCGTCVDVCPALAHERTGSRESVESVMEAVRKDMPFYDQTGGGVTFSGGEPLMQPSFLKELLMACGGLGVHRAVDTSGFAGRGVLLDVAGATDLFLFDLKHMDDETHRKYTGVSNTDILANIAALAASGKDMAVRIPLMPGINDDEANLEATGAFAAGLPGVHRVDVLPYHAAARSKYAKLGMDYPGSDIPRFENGRVERAVTILKRHGLNVRVGG